MAKYTTTTSVSVYDSIEDAVAGLDTKISAADVTRLNMKYDILQTQNGKYAAWLVYTDEA
jgi:hypothetical protein